MGFTYPDRQKDDENGGDVIVNSKKSHTLGNHSALHVSGFKEWTLAKAGKSGRTLILKFLQSEPFENWIQEFVVKRSPNVGISIPKQLVSLEEKYLKRCMEQIHMNALQGAHCAISVGLSPLQMGFESDHTFLGKRDSFDLPNFAIDYPMAVGTEELSPLCEDDEIVGSIMGSDSMMTILSSPLFLSLGAKKLFENERRRIPSDYQGSPGRLMMCPSQSPGNENLDIRNQGYRPNSVRKSLNFESNAAFLTDQSSPPSLSQGMLRCTWANGIPHFAFSLDDQKELYVANAGKAEVVHGKAVDFVYTFHFKVNGKKLSELSDIESDIIGKMQVSSSFSPCSDNTKVMETKFVLFGTNDSHAREINTLSRNSKRSRKLSKVMEIFKAGPSLKHRTPSIYSSSNVIPEDVSEDQESTSDLSKTDYISNLELAAIVVKSHLQNEDHEPKQVGGWGLKFLKKPRVKPTVESLDVSERCRHDAGTCSTSMDIIVPAGPHGGPSTRNGGPSSLIERWRSNGHCDCGGWDIGCPLKVLKARPRSEEGWLTSESQGDCKSFDMFTQGSEQGTPTVKMVNIRDGLYFISFQSTSLSPLQCFAIAVATIHSKSPSLRPRHAQD